MEANSIINHSCLDMCEVPDNSVHLIVTSPPYNVEIQYSTYRDTKSYVEYVKFTLAWVGECVRVLVAGGRIAIDVANTGRKPYYHLNNLIVNACLAHGLIPVEEYVWNKGRAIAAAKTSWGSWKDAKNPYPRDCHELIEVFYKPKYELAFRGFDRCDKPVYKLDCEGFPKAQFLTGHDFALDSFSVWDIKPERSREHPAPFPVELARRIIEFFTRPGMWVLDPFGGWGTTAVACLILPEPRHYILYEIDAQYVKLAKNRLKLYQGPKLHDFLKQGHAGKPPASKSSGTACLDDFATTKSRTDSPAANQATSNPQPRGPDGTLAVTSPLPSRERDGVGKVAIAADSSTRGCEQG